MPEYAIPTIGTAPNRTLDSTTYNNFKVALEDQVTVILEDAVGVGTDDENFVKNWWNIIKDFDLAVDVPFVVVTARNDQQARGPREMGTARELWDWTVHMYYVDVDQYDFQNGRLRQGNLVQRMQNALENEPRLRELRVVVNPNNPSGAYNEYVYNNDFTTVSWDASGQDGYWAFVSELYLTVQTARN